MPKDPQLVSGSVVLKLGSIYIPKSVFLPLTHAVFPKEKGLKENDLVLGARKCESRLERKGKREQSIKIQDYPCA